VTSHPASEDSELLAFFNCGWDSGASQKHCHVQCIEVRREDLRGTEATQDSNADEEDDDAEGLIPIEKLLSRIEKDGREHDAVHALPVPWQHFVSLLDAGKAKKAESVDAYLANRLMTLLDTMLQAKRILTTIATETSTKDPSDGSRSGGLMGGGGPPSFNLLLTKRAMHLIPRRRENYTLNGEWPEVNGKKLGEMSINAMGELVMVLAHFASSPDLFSTMQDLPACYLSSIPRK
jgi:sulfate adenylyltransferase (ADP) / ATP adenylyltransferase